MNYISKVRRVRAGYYRQFGLLTFHTVTIESHKTGAGNWRVSLYDADENLVERVTAWNLNEAKAISTGMITKKQHAKANYTSIKTLVNLINEAMKAAPYTNDVITYYLHSLNSYL